MSPVLDTSSRPAVYRYHLLRAALANQEVNLEQLSPTRLAAIKKQADQTFELENLVLASAEAADVIIPSQRLEAAIEEVAGRYQRPGEFIADLERNGLDEKTLQDALRRELVFDACLQRVGARRPPISELDERLFYRLHRERFTEPERRSVRQILITINQDFAENHRQAALTRIQALATKLADKPNRFPNLARQHSECPSALEDGRLGRLARGQLYPQLDRLLFSLQAGQIGGPVESEIGFHLLWCEKIHPARTLPFAKIRGRIRQTLEDRAARNCQKAWIGELRLAVQPETCQ